MKKNVEKVVKEKMIKIKRYDELNNILV